MTHLLVQTGTNSHGHFRLPARYGADVCERPRTVLAGLLSPWLDTATTMKPPSRGLGFIHTQRHIQNVSTLTLLVGEIRDGRGMDWLNPTGLWVTLVTPTKCLHCKPEV